MMREYERRLRKMEEARGSTDGAFVMIRKPDGSSERVLWVSAVEMALADELEGDPVDGELADLVAALMQDSSKTGGGN